MIAGADVSFVIDVEQNGLTTTVGAQEKEQIDRTANLSTDIYLKLNLFKEYFVRLLQDQKQIVYVIM